MKIQWKSKNVSKGLMVVSIVVMGIVGFVTRPALGAGTPGEVLLSDKWRALYAYFSPITNPALMTERMYSEARFVAYLPYDAMGNIFEAGLTVPVGLYQSVGGTWVGQQDAPVTDDFVLKTHQFSANNFSLSYAINPWDRLSAGLNVNVANQNIFDSAASFGYGVDVGISYHLLHPFFGKNVFGVSYVNALAQQQAFFSNSSKSDSGYKPSESGYASQLKFLHHIEVSEGFFENNLQLSLTDFTSAQAVYKNGRQTPWAIAEHALFRPLRNISIHAIAGIENNSFSYWGLGIGFNFPTVLDGRDMEALYQFRSAPNAELSFSSSVYARAQVGPHREEIYARKMAAQLDASPADLYNKALTLYSAQKYWDAYFVFNRIIRQFPDFFKNDWVSYYAHSCQEKMDMRKLAFSGYAEVMSGYQTSTVAPFAQLGIMRIAYRNGDNEELENQFKTIFQITVPDSIRFHAAYLMGETYMRQGLYSRALQLFMLIPQKHPQYLFAQHSMAVAAMNNDNKPEAQASLENCTGQFNQPGQSASQKEIISRSLVLLGYLFYENGFMGKAVSALRLVSETSYYYEDALLGLGWAALKSSQWTDCIAVGKSLQRVTQRPWVSAEGMLMEAFSATATNQWQPAVEILKLAQTQLANAPLQSEDSLAQQKRMYLDNRFSYDNFALDVADCARSSLTTNSVAKIDSLHTKQIEMKKPLEKFLVYADEFNRTRLFNRTVADVKNDIDYALIIAQNKISNSKADKAGEATLKQQQDIDKEIEKVQKEMEEIKK